MRLRLTRSEVAQFTETGSVEERIEFGLEPAQQFVYRLELDTVLNSVRANFENNRLLISIPKADAEKWKNSNQIGIEARQRLGDEKDLRILIEKDFACSETRPGEDESDAFSHPLDGDSLLI